MIMCGGSGTRLWPASRESLPKQFIALVGDRSTFQETMLRVTEPDLFDRPVIITNSDFRFVVAEQLRQIGIDATIVLEPMPRDSAPAVSAAVSLVTHRAARALVLVLAADHAIADVAGFHQSCRDATHAAEKGHIVTFGVRPTEPATGYGYLEAGAALADGRVHKLARFHEKPTQAAATDYIQKGFLWNSGNLLFRCDVMAEELEGLQPDIRNATQAAVAASTRDLDFLRLDEAAFARAPKISIDYAVMEKTSLGAVLAVDYGWSDLGSWDAVWAHLPHNEAGNVVSGPCELLGVQNALVQSDESILTTVIGLNDVLVVTYPDAVLVAPRTVTSEIKTLVETMKASGRAAATSHRRILRPWGFYEQMTRGNRHLVRRTVVNPHQRLTLQVHHHRSEHWVIVRGKAEITIGDQTRELRENESVYIPADVPHRLANPGEAPLELIEVQVGAYLGEDDIERLENGARAATA